MGKTARVTVAPKQSLGQNFLIDENIARNIVQSLSLTEDDVIVEIGPGQGALTQYLAGQAGHLIATEIDQRVIEELRKKFATTNVEILHKNFLDVDLEELSRQHHRRLRVIGNIPYHLTSPILFKVFEQHAYVYDITMMMQREVARRIVGQPGTKEYGILSIFSQYYGTSKLLFNVSPNCFYPKPNVTSTVVHFALHEHLPYNVNIDLFKIVVKTTFGKRRKTLRNSLQYLPFDEQRIQAILEKINFPLEKRPEELLLEGFINLAQQIEMIGTCR
jgi:16S rRNA (adenine1518-N6/adenine1519-N6)-dimethyltransferase